MFDDYTLGELKAFRKQLSAKMLENAGLGSFSLPDGVSISIDSGNLERVLQLLNETIRRKEGRGSRFVGIEIRP